MHQSSGGCCDCGDPEAWTSHPWCEIHQGKEVCTDEDDETDEIHLRTKEVNQKLNDLPQNVVIRLLTLFKPMLDSVNLACFDLFQTNEFRSDRIMSKTKTEPMETDGSKSLFDTESGSGSTDSLLYENWPPPCSYIPRSQSSADCGILSIDSFPRTAPRFRTTEVLADRCRKQLEFVHKIHPRLYPLPNGDEMDFWKQNYCVILYNNEFHNYDQVIKTLKRVLHKSFQDATGFVLMINNEGRSIISNELNLKNAASKAASIMSTSKSISSKPLSATASHWDIVKIENLCVHIIQWIMHLSERVPSVRPVICNAVFGRFTKESFIQENENQRIFVEHPDQFCIANSFIYNSMVHHTILWKILRRESQNLLMGLVTKEPFYRLCLSIVYVKHCHKIFQGYIYDDHKEIDNLISLDCQLFTVISVSKILLEDHNVLTKFLTFFHRCISANSVLLPNSTDAPDAEQTADSPDNFNQNLDPTNSMNSVILYDRLKNVINNSIKPYMKYRMMKNLVHGLNSDIWRQIDEGRDVIPAKVLVWAHDSPISRTRFNPFERIFSTIRTIGYILGSLLNSRPLPVKEGQATWWSERALSNFMDYFRLFVDLLCHFQDMKSFQRAVRLHVEHEIQWMDDYFLLITLLDEIGLTCQVCTTHRDLFDMAIKHVQDVFYRRVGIYDLRFRVDSQSSQALYDSENLLQKLDKGDQNIFHRPLEGPSKEDNQDIPTGANENKEDKVLIDELIGFQAFGVSTEVFAYDVGRYRFSLMQPIPRLLAAMNGLALEMGKDIDLLKLKDKKFANLLLERPLQVFSFIAQCNANLWVRNGIGIMNYLATMTSHLVHSETIDRDLQLIQQISAFMPPDELHFRIAHKFNLINYLLQKDSEPLAGRVSSMVMYLRIILNMITDRFRPSIGHFDSTRVQGNKTRFLFEKSSEPLIPYDIETRDPVLMEDLIHFLSIQRITYSDLIANLPTRPGNAILTKETSESELDPQKSLTNRGAHRDVREKELQLILPKISITTKINGKQVFSIKPEIAFCRFNRFYYQNHSSEQMMAEETIKMKMASIKNSSSLSDQEKEFLETYPSLPPAPVPVFSFNPEFSGILRLVQCPTFIRIIRHSLDIGIQYRRQSNWWSHDISDLILHILQVALYEDVFESEKSGRYPFLEGIERVSMNNETDEELDALRKSEFWLRADNQPAEPIAKADWKDNCIVTRLHKMLEEDVANNDLIVWTLNLWKKVAFKRLNLKLNSQCDDLINVKTDSSKTQEDLKNEMFKKCQSIFEQMKEQQQKAVSSFLQFMSDDEEEDNDDPSLLLSSQQDDKPKCIALGMNRQTNIGNNSITPTESAVCNLCLEETPLTAETPVKKKLLMNAYVCRSNALSVRNETKCAHWDNGYEKSVSRETHAVLEAKIKQLLEISSLQASTSMMSPFEMGFAYLPWSLQEMHRIQLISKKYLSRMKASRLTSTNDPRKLFEVGRIPLPGKDKNQSLFTSQITYRDGFNEAENYWYSHLDKSFKHLKPDETDEKKIDSINYLASLQSIGCCDPFKNGKLMNIIGIWKDNDHFYDPDKPLPLVQPRLTSSIEQYPIMAICPHAMHPECKERYGIQQKSQIAEHNRRRNNLSSFEFRCPLCKAISLIDLPMFGPLHSIEKASKLWYNKCLEFKMVNFSKFVSNMRAWCEKKRIDVHCDIYGVKNNKTVYGFLNTLFEYADLARKIEADDEFMKLPPEQKQEKQNKLTEKRQHILEVIRKIKYRLQFTLHNKSKTSNIYEFLAIPKERRKDFEINVTEIMSTLPSDTFQNLSSSRSTNSFTVSNSLWTMVQKISSNLKPYSLFEILHRPFVHVNSGLESRLNRLFELNQDIYPEKFDDESNDDPKHWKYQVPKLSKRIGTPPAFQESLSDLLQKFSNLEIKLEQLIVKLDEAKSTSTVEVEDSTFISIWEVRTIINTVMKQALTLLNSSLSDWRTLRQVIANTFSLWEKNTRQSNWHANFFNGEISEYNVICLKHLLKSSLISHTKFATVSPGCPNTNQCTDRDCWPNRRNDSINWWWWSLVCPMEYLGKPVHLKYDCHQPENSSLAFLFENVNRIAATEDAEALWNLLIPSHESKDNSIAILRVMTSFLDITGSPIGVNQVGEDIVPGLPNPHHLPPLFTGDDEMFEFSLMVDVDITSLYINLLHLRPGLESFDYDDCSCRKAGDSTDPILGFCCDNGRLRVPIGDYYETYLTKICYLAVLIQSILSWKPSSTGYIAPFRENEIKSAKNAGWYSVKLLKIWRRLRVLSGLDDEVPVEFDQKLLINNLSDHVRTRIIPFLRLATFLIQIITQVPLPEGLTKPLKDQNHDELSQMLSYLGLPSCLEDLSIILSGKEVAEDDEDTAVKESLDLDDSFTLLKLITSWSLQVRNCISRRLNHALNRRYALLPESYAKDDFKIEASQPEKMQVLLEKGLVKPLLSIDTSPDINTPKLINLPLEYSDILALASEYLCLSSGQNNSDPCLCLVCGHIACLTCYGCRIFEKIPRTIENSLFSGSEREYNINSMQAHIRTHHSGYAVVLKMYSCSVILLSDQARRLTNLPEIYKDAFGEPDIDLKRGNVLYLVEKEYEKLNKIWLSHQKILLSSSEINTSFMELL